MFEQTLQLVRRGVEEGAFPGAAAAIGRGEEVLAQGVFGLAQLPAAQPAGAAQSAGEPVTPRTLFDLASLTKLLCTTMVTLRLMAAGRLAPEDELEKWFGPQDCPDAALWRRRRHITLHQLLTHTAGFQPAGALREARPAADAARSILLSPPAGEVGAQAIYSCYGFILLQQLLQRCTGQGLDELAQREVFAPLGMPTAGFCPLRAGRTDIAATEWPTPRGRYVRGEVHDDNAWYLGGVSGNAGAFASLEDLLPFAAMLSQRGRLRGGRYLPAGLFAAAVRDYTPQSEESRGWGFHLKPVGRPFAGGSLMAPGSYGHTGFTGVSLFVDAASGLYGLLLTNALRFGRDKTTYFAVRDHFYDSMTREYAADQTACESL